MTTKPPSGRDQSTEAGKYVPSLSLKVNNAAGQLKFQKYTDMIAERSASRPKLGTVTLIKVDDPKA